MDESIKKLNEELICIHWNK